MSHPIPLAEQMKALEHLQELDMKIDNLKRNKSALPGALKALDQSLSKLNADIGAKKIALGELEKTQKQARAALDLNRDRLSRSNAKIDSVQNSQEYNAINKEVEQLKKMNASLDEQVKKADDETAGLNKQIDDLNAQVQKVQGERESQAGVLITQGGALDSEIGTLMAERSKYTGQVDPRTLAQYERVRPARAGLGIVPAVGGRCKGCNMVVPPQLYNEIRKLTTVHSCPSCHRILFVPAENGGTTQG